MCSWFIGWPSSKMPETTQVSMCIAGSAENLLKSMYIVNTYIEGSWNFDALKKIGIYFVYSQYWPNCFSRFQMSRVVEGIFQWSIGVLFVFVVEGWAESQG